MATHREASSERSREHARIADPVLRGIWILPGLLAMLGGTRVRFPDLREALAAWRPALFFVALGGYCLALGTAGYDAFRRGPRQRTSFSVRKRRTT